MEDSGGLLGYLSYISKATDKSISMLRRLFKSMCLVVKTLDSSIDIDDNLKIFKAITHTIFPIDKSIIPMHIEFLSNKLKEIFIILVLYYEKFQIKYNADVMYSTIFSTYKPTLFLTKVLLASKYDSKEDGLYLSGMFWEFYKRVTKEIEEVDNDVLSMGLYRQDEKLITKCLEQGIRPRAFDMKILFDNISFNDMAEFKMYIKTSNKRFDMYQYDYGVYGDSDFMYASIINLLIKYGYTLTKEDIDMITKHIKVNDINYDFDKKTLRE